VKKNGFTFAPETGSERLRRVINKNITDASLLEAVGTAYRRGWSLVKLYFMIGLPTETMEDVNSIASLIERVNQVGRQSGGGKRVNASVGAHVPKAFTPFQWEGFESLQSLETKLGSLKRRYQNHRFVRLKWHDLRPSFLEAVFSLGDRRVGRAIEAAWRRGARFDGWGECFDWNRWMRAFEDVGLDPAFYTRARALDEILPWDLLDADLTKKFLLRERRKAFEERLTNDCRWGDCHMCGIPNAPDDIQLAVDRPQALGVDGRTGLDGNLIRKAGYARKIPIAPMAPTEALAPAVAAIELPADGESEEPAESPDDRERVRLRLMYRTGEEVRYVAHADLMRAFHRAFRVARVPVVMSQGFTPRPKAAFGPPLPLGVTGAREAMDVDFHPPVPHDLVARLNAALPAGIAVDSVGDAPSGPALAAAVTAADYRVALPADIAETAVATRIAAFEAAAEFSVTKERHGRPDRTVDLKKAVLQAEHRAGEVRFRLAMNAADGQQVSASVVLGSLLGWSREEIAASRIERLRLHTADGPL
jgi:radical SAM-linked protein